MIALPEKPAWLFLEINNVCNLRCKQCHIWMNPPAQPGTLELEEQKQIIREFAGWPGGENPRVVIGGGEALLNPERVIPLVCFAREQNVRVEIITNGSKLDADLSPQLGDAAPDLVHISIDAPRAEVHDSIRGVRGGFEQVVSNVREFNKHRDRRTRLSVNAIVCNRTLPFLLEHVDFAKELGADQVRFLPLAPTIGNRGERDPFFEKEAFATEQDIVKYLDPLIALARKDAFIENNEEDLAFMRRYLGRPEAVVRKEEVCDAGRRTMMIDQYGGVTFCFYMIPHFAGRPVCNIREGNLSLRELWTRDSSQEVRLRMIKCKEPCGLLSCHRKNGPH